MVEGALLLVYALITSSIWELYKVLARPTLKRMGTRVRDRLLPESKTRASKRRKNSRSKIGSQRPAKVKKSASNDPQ